jgi:hypothetical protein
MTQHANQILLELKEKINTNHVRAFFAQDSVIGKMPSWVPGIPPIGHIEKSRIHYLVVRSWPADKRADAIQAFNRYLRTIPGGWERKRTVEARMASTLTYLINLERLA